MFFYFANISIVPQRWVTTSANILSQIYILKHSSYTVRGRWNISTRKTLSFQTHIYWAYYAMRHRQNISITMSRRSINFAPGVLRLSCLAFAITSAKWTILRPSDNSDSMRWWTLYLYVCDKRIFKGSEITKYTFQLDMLASYPLHRWPNAVNALHCFNRRRSTFRQIKDSRLHQCICDYIIWLAHSFTLIAHLNPRVTHEPRRRLSSCVL